MTSVIENESNARNLLIEQNLRLVFFVAKKFNRTRIENEDLISIGTIGLIKAINTFKKDKNIMLSTYASRCIENEILMYLRKTSKQEYEVSFDEPLNKDNDGNELYLYDLLGTEDDMIFEDVEKEFNNRLLIKALDILNERERTLIELRYGIGNIKQEMTQLEVANYLGYSQSYISRLEKTIMKKLKKEILRLS